MKDIDGGYFFANRHIHLVLKPERIKHIDPLDAWTLATNLRRLANALETLPADTKIDEVIVDVEHEFYSVVLGQTMGD